MRAAQQGSHPGQQLLGGERLRQVVVGARVQPRDPVGDLVTGGQHQDRQIPTRGPQPSAGLQPAEARHHHVEDQQIQRVTVGPTDPVEHGETVGDGAGVVTLDLEHPLQRLTDGRVIIRDQDPHSGPPPPFQSMLLPLILPGQPEARIRTVASVAPVGRALGCDKARQPEQSSVAALTG
nr:hypothetical protein GCM10020092_054170 [Actinoplanes digitatis]